MIEDVETGRLIATEVRLIEPQDIPDPGTGWKFDWCGETEQVEVFKLINPEIPNTILGLLGLIRHDSHDSDRYVEVTLLESSPSNVGETKRFDGIAGSLFAFAAQLSFAIGGDGFIAIDAKTGLIDHFRDTYGFVRVGNSQRMYLPTEPAERLIATFAKEPEL